MTEHAKKSTSKQGLFAKYQPSARTLRWLMNCWPTFRFVGIRVREIAADFSYVRVTLTLRLLNRNYVGTAFGGSLFSMTDPFCMIMLMRRLGPGHLVWDKAASITFIKPGRGTITCEFKFDDAEIARVRELLKASEKIEPVYTIDLLDQQGVLVAQVQKTVYIRRLSTSDVPA
jgi:acyl-coenzyme A thioesterase PaaI-like protein